MLKALLLAPPALTLAVAESLTGGRVQARITAISGASQFFLGGVTVYSLEAKVRLLGVDALTVRLVNGVSAEVARQMARGACQLFGADLALATTGYAEPVPERGIAIPRAHWALRHCLPGGGEIFREGYLEFPDQSRLAVQDQVATVAFDGLVEYLAQWRANEAAKGI